MDVPDVSFCIIERAELFGLSQLHQIRGRIGRGASPPGEQVNSSFCVLLYDDSDGPEASVRAEERLRPLELNTDGFTIAEADLALRGPGDVLGVVQTGYSKDVRYRIVVRNAGKNVQHTSYLFMHMLSEWRIRRRLRWYSRRRKPQLCDCSANRTLRRMRSTSPLSRCF